VGYWRVACRFRQTALSGVESVASAQAQKPQLAQCSIKNWSLWLQK